ncbi:unnamed protein product [Alternaria alternata]
MATTTAPPIADWQTLAQSKRESVFAAIPKDWLLPPSQTSQYTETSSISVLDVPRTCGILTEKELDITENYDATDLDSFNVRGVQATLGYVSFIPRPPSATNSALVDVLHELGAVFYVKTNLPQTMMTADSHNNIFGRTLNPNNLSHTAGGSTGGEGALLAMKGSVLGVATDIAGSNRIPAICCGGSSLKPTAGRVPFAGGVAVGRLGSPGSIPVVIGPCGRSTRDYELFMKSVVSARPYRFDENCLNVPWRSVSSPLGKPLRFGLIRGCKERPLHPPVARGLHTTAMKLKAAGHEIVLLDDKIPDLYHTTMLAWKFFMLDPKKTPFHFIKDSGEPMVPSLSTMSFPELEGWQATLDELWDMNVEKAKIVKKFHQLVVGDVSREEGEGGEKGLDAILMPGYQDDANDCEGLPTHVQVVGKSMMDEELVEVMKIVEGVLRD